MKTLRDFWDNFEGVVDFFNKNGEGIDDMDYPLETEVLEKKETSTGYWQVTLNVDNSTMKKKKAGTVKIVLTCPHCGNSTWSRLNTGEFECLACGDTYSPEEMCSEAIRV